MPRPPILVPATRAAPSPVKVESITAAGTLLITWLRRTAHHSSRPSSREAITSRTLSIRPTLPTKTKKQTKVSSRL